ncbi:MAG: hypothetical protein MZV64_43000 [Ignavibacteriales bacterium]|nr:hypothetical protein [Ignavibacteriales bacterium]
MQREVPEVPVVATGLSWLRQFWPHVAAGLAEGRRRALRRSRARHVRLPRRARRSLMARGALDPVKCCIACSRCTELMRLGSTAGCAVRDHPLYSSLHRSATRAARSAP